MMDALKGLMPAQAAPAAAGSGEATETSTTSAAKDDAKALKEAAYGFAHELFQALKSVGASNAEASGDAGGCRPRRCGGYGEPADGAKAYGGLAQGLQRLAQSLAPAASPAVTTTDAAAVEIPVATTVDLPVEAPVAKATELSTVKTPETAAAPDESPLLAAFKKLMRALNPAAADATTGAQADAKTPAELLQAFLQQIAKSLGADGVAAGDALPAKGSLIDVSA